MAGLGDLLKGLGGAQQLELQGIIQSRVSLETAISAAFGIDIIGEILTSGKLGLFSDAGWVAEHVLELINKTDAPIGKTVFESLVTKPMGVNLTNVAPENRQGIDTIERVIGFATELSLGTAAVAGAIEPLLGSHALKGLLEAVRQVPDEIGLNYFMGTVMANVFETSTGTPLREAISEQVRPARLEWPQLGRLLKMHEITQTDAEDRLRKAGFRDPDIAILTKLNRQLLSVGEIQQLFEIGYFNLTQFRDYLDVLGFNANDANAMLALVTHKASTIGENTVRRLAGTQFRDGTLSETAYREILKQTETPQQSIDLLVSEAKLEQSTKILHESITAIKDLYQHAHITANEARQRLALRGMSDADISDLILVWEDQRKVGRSGIGTNKILGYLIGGVIDKTTAYNHLIANGVNQQDAQFLVDNPSTHGSVVSKPLTTGTIISAFKDDVLSIDDARALLEQIKVNPEEIDLLLANATATKTRGIKPRASSRRLSEANILEALKLGLVSPEWAERELETVGYQPADATLLVVIELTKLDKSYPSNSGWQQLT